MIGIIGLGLIGGSLAALIQKQHPNTPIFAIDTDPASIAIAKEKKWITSGYTTLSECTDTPTLLFICTPLSLIKETVIAASKQFAEKPLIITDVGSVKTPFIISEKELSKNHTYIPGHPMAGSEKNGIAFAKAEILKKATYFLIQKEQKNTLTTLLESLTFNLVFTTSEAHDHLMSSASHMPYLLSCLTIANSMTTPQLSSGISTGFKDTTRIAESNPEWGKDILLLNQKNILKELENLEKNIKNIKKWIQENNTEELTKYLSEIQHFRKKLYNK